MTQIICYEDSYPKTFDATVKTKTSIPIQVITPLK